MKVEQSLSGIFKVTMDEKDVEQLDFISVRTGKDDENVIENLLSIGMELLNSFLMRK